AGRFSYRLFLAPVLGPGARAHATLQLPARHGTVGAVPGGSAVRAEKTQGDAVAEQTVVGGPRSRARSLVAALVASLALVLAPVSPAAAANGRLKVVVQVPQDIKPGLPNHVLGLYLLHEGEWRLSTRV